MAKALDGMVVALAHKHGYPQGTGRDAASFRNRPPDFWPLGCLWLDALTWKVREGGRVAGISCVVAIAVSAGGRREAPGCGFITTEDGAGWTAFLRGLLSRGLSGVRLAVSGAQAGRVDAAALAFFRRCLAEVPRPFRPQLTLKGASGLPGPGGHSSAPYLRPARR